MTRAGTATGHAAANGAVTRATISADDIRRKYYDSAGYSMWITEIQLDPLQLIVVDDETGKFYRVPITLTGDEITFGERKEVAVTYVDVSTKVAASAIVWANRDKSRAFPVDRAALAAALDLPADAGDEQLRAALAAALPPAAVPDAPTGPDLAAQRAAWEAERAAERASVERDRLLDTAVAQGRIRPADRATFAAAYDANPTATRATIAAMPANRAFPTTAAGYMGTDGAQSPADAVYALMYPEQHTNP